MNYYRLFWRLVEVRIDSFCEDARTSIFHRNDEDSGIARRDRTENAAVSPFTWGGPSEIDLSRWFHRTGDSRAVGLKCFLVSQIKIG
jgi:hypothetical protein